MIRSEWSCINRRIKIDVEIPSNTTALLYLPEKNEPIELGSGCYNYEYDTELCLERDRFSLESTLQDILNEPLAVQMINEHASEMLDHPMIKLKFVYQSTIGELLGHTPEMKPLLENIIDALNKKYRGDLL